MRVLIRGRKAVSLQENLQKAEKYLKRFKDKPILNHINGQDMPASDGKTFEVISPIDLKPIAQTAHGTKADIDSAATAAKEAFQEWAGISGVARKKILHKIADIIEARAEEISLVESVDTGQAIRFMAKAAIRGAENFRYFADMAPTARDGQSLYNESQINITSRKPIGAIGIITPWNTPFMLSTWKIAPALASGCTIVHKPAELSPLTARLLVEIATEAGLPKGVWNLVNGMGEDTGRALTEHEAIKAIAFVGESRTGTMITKQGADTLKRYHFELGGKNPVIVFANSDLERAADAAIFMIYSLNGERCTSSSRLLVEESIYDEFTLMVVSKAKNIKVGHPLDPKTVIGPLIHPTHFDKVTSYFDIAKAEGATIALGGEPVQDIESNFHGNCSGNCYVPPTLFTNAHNKMRIAQEEIFGPVLTAIPFKTEQDAINIANDVDYGLAAYLWTDNTQQALRVSDALEAGMVWVNSENLRHLPSPFGGMKYSGIGRDGGDWSFDFYMETKNIGFATKPHKIPQLGA
ncbi:MAG: 5-carboxymethyl-2-hydroxymuconate semialdehyde dehydrogenase [Alphaproteobacteria bacterium]|nr:5-carboxymethyl-2-hydroxymuconate semialdehyde dehydrogenase [Alphaproteobacteria bacterium]